MGKKTSRTPLTLCSSSRSSVSRRRSWLSREHMSRHPRRAAVLFRCSPTHQYAQRFSFAPVKQTQLSHLDSPAWRPLLDAQDPLHSQEPRLIIVRLPNHIDGDHMGRKGVRILVPHRQGRLRPSQRDVEPVLKYPRHCLLLFSQRRPRGGIGCGGMFLWVKGLLVW